MHICDYPNCGKIYTKTSHLRAHLRSALYSRKKKIKIFKVVQFFRSFFYLTTVVTSTYFLSGGILEISLTYVPGLIALEGNFPLLAYVFHMSLCQDETLMVIYHVGGQ